MLHIASTKNFEMHETIKKVVNNKFQRRHVNGTGNRRKDYDKLLKLK